MKIGHLTKFDQIIDKVLEHEGGYVDDANDPGGETKYGILDGVNGLTTNRNILPLHVQQLTCTSSKSLNSSSTSIPACKANSLSK